MRPPASAARVGAARPDPVASTVGGMNDVAGTELGDHGAWRAGSRPDHGNAELLRRCRAGAHERHGDGARDDLVPETHQQDAVHTRPPRIAAHLA